MADAQILKAGLDSPVGPLTIVVQDDAIVKMDWGRCRVPDQHPVLSEGVAQMTAYFAGELRDFDLPLAPDVSAFQKYLVQHYLQSLTAKRAPMVICPKIWPHQRKLSGRHVAPIQWRS